MNQFSSEIVATTSPASDQTARVLKSGDCFGVFDSHGDIVEGHTVAHGVYQESTRFLSKFELRIENTVPFLLNSSIVKDNTTLVVDLTNPDMWTQIGNKFVSKGTLYIVRTKYLWNKTCLEKVEISNYGLEPLSSRLSFHYFSDFVDMFEIRGTPRKRRGKLFSPKVNQSSVQYVYKGLDAVVRQAEMRFWPEGYKLFADHCDYNFTLKPQEKRIFLSSVTFGEHQDSVEKIHQVALQKIQTQVKESLQRSCKVTTSNDIFNQFIERSQSDLHMMVSSTSEGFYPYAGVPWYNTVFGRDGIITALECLWTDPSLAKGVLAFLAKTQALELNSKQDAEPGKILHEIRSGEMVNLGEVPFEKYYGSVDSTPLFIILAAAYFRATSDSAFLYKIWPNILKALEWIDRYGDIDQDGFVEYQRKTEQGLQNQGWKDSYDSISHADGMLAKGPVALCEVQAYVYQAKLDAAELAWLFDEQELASALLDQAKILRTNFKKAFWSNELNNFCLALDGNKKPCQVKSSNAGHVLFCGLANAEQAKKVANTLLGPEMFSGWGIRTLGCKEKRFNPMSYHNGSIWPHDNALIGEGFSRYNLKHSAEKILTALFDVANHVDLNRVPELYCGFERKFDRGPTLYPVACAPQSWASASIFMLLKAILGLSVDGVHSQIRFFYPRLPAYISELRLSNFRVGKSSADLLLTRHQDDVSIRVLQKSGPIEILLIK